MLSHASRDALTFVKVGQLGPAQAHRMLYGGYPYAVIFELTDAETCCCCLHSRGNAMLCIS